MAKLMIYVMGADEPIEITNVENGVAAAYEIGESGFYYKPTKRYHPPHRIRYIDVVE